MRIESEGERPNLSPTRGWGFPHPSSPPCLWIGHHEACDRVDDVDRVALCRFTDAVDASLRRFAASTADGPRMISRMRPRE